MTHGELSFKPLTLLRTDGSIIESATMTPTELYDFIVESTHAIANHIENTYKREVLKARRPELKERISIHAARLALHEWDKSVFNTLNMQEIRRITTSPDILVPKAREYWDAVKETFFEPEIHIRGLKATEGTSGVWLNLKTPT
ncbi:hypothetical protein H7100_00360 [Candidatus Saccharibacteria bacterium]|nr:hypothetical protein [Candidatus Saccharibacteria bacterium]